MGTHMTEPTPHGAFQLVAGLGNPGRRYRDTRHNVGFLVVEQLAERLGSPLAETPKWNARVARPHNGPVLVQPLTFMNLSGDAIGALSRFYKIDPRHILVVYDEVDLPLGRLRLRPSGSAGGHNGMQSIIDHLGSQAVPRLRVGIGQTGPGRDLTGHVLGKFSPDERSLLEKSVEKAVDAVLYAHSEGVESAMTRFNAPSRPPEEKKTQKEKPESDQPEGESTTAQETNA